MIFVTLGSQKFQFNRLLIEIDRLIDDGIIKEPVYAQVGYSDYKPIHYEYKAFLTREEFSSWMDKADVVITHGGTGAIIGAVKKGKRVIAVPRMKKYGEHVDDHQKEIVIVFAEMNIIQACHDIDEMKELYLEIRHKRFFEYQSNTSKIIQSIKEYIEGI